MNPSTTKKQKSNSKDIPIPKNTESKQSDKEQQKSYENNLDQLATEKKPNDNQSRKNLVLSNNNQNLNAKTEVKDRKKKSCNSQILSYDLKDDINKNENKEKKKKKRKIISTKNIPTESPIILGDNNNPSPREITKSQNVDIKMNVNPFNNEIEENNNNKNIQIYNPNQRHLTCKLIPQMKSKRKDNLEHNKTLVTEKIKDINDMLIPENDLEESQTIQTNKRTKFPNLSTNPFITENKKKSLNLNEIPNKNISDLKKNFIQNDNNDLNNTNTNANTTTNKEQKEFVHHTKNLTFKIDGSKSPTTKKNSSNISSQKTLTTNTEISENSNLDNMYRKLLLFAKRGDKEKFLEIYGFILNSQKENMDKNYKDENGFTALHYACDEGNLKIVEVLIEAKYDPNIKNNYKQTPLHLSANRGYFDISKKLIESGAILNTYDSEKNSPLHYVCKNNYIELLKYFLSKSPQVEEKNIYGKTPKDLTTNSEMKNLLDDFIAKKNNKTKSNNIINDTMDLISKTKVIKKEIKSSKNVITTKNRTKILNQKTKGNTLIQHNSKNDINSPNKKQETEIKTHHHKNDLINASTNIKIELDSNNILNNSSNTSPNKSPNSSNVANSKNSFLKKERKTKLVSNINLIDKKKSQESPLSNNTREKKDSNIYFQNTNNINNNSININIYSIEGVKRTRTNTKYASSKNKEYITIDESKLNNSNNININKTTIAQSNTINNQANKKPIKDRRNVNISKSKFQKNKIKNILDSIGSCDNNIFNLNKTEENIITSGHKFSKNLNLNNSANISIKNKNVNKNIKNKYPTNNSKTIQSTEQLLSKSKFNTKKKESKFKPVPKNINESVVNHLNSMNLSKISPHKNKKLISDLDIINRSNIISSNAQKILNITNQTTEHITPNNFVCLAQLGKGSFGEVYLVKKVNSEEIYAMKVLRKERIMGQNLLKYAIAERNVLKASNHPFIVKLHYAFQTSTKLFLVIEYCPNGDLAKHLLIEKRFKEPRAKFYICEVLLALEDLHKRDIIFRDLKPDNVVLDKDGHCKLTDFGLSKEGVRENFYAQSFCGSIAYLAPEMLKKQGHGKAVDWYLLGVLFYEMLVGVTPYFTTKKEDIFYNIEYGDLKIPNFVSKEAGELLERLLERNPNKRLGGSIKDGLEIKEHPYFKDVDWKKMYEKKLKPPNYVNYMDKAIKYYHKPRFFANNDFLNKTEEDKPMPNMLRGWSFINKDEKV